MPGQQRDFQQRGFWLRLLAATDTVPHNITQSPLALADEMVAILTVSVVKLKRGLERPHRPHDDGDS